MKGIVTVFCPRLILAGSHKAEAKLSQRNKGHQLKTVHNAFLVPILSSAPTLTSSFSGFDQTPISVLVTDCVTHTPNKTYNTYVVFRGILLGGLSRLQDTTKDFT